MNDKKCFRGSLGDYEWRVTDDNSLTLYSHYFEEACHSLSGGHQETLHNYIQGCDILSLAKNHRPLVIFEVGFGTGLGLRCTLDSLPKKNSQLLFVSCELDEALAMRSLEALNATHLEKHSIDDLHYLSAKIEGQSVLILLGDVRVSLPIAIKSGIFPKCHAIYQDPFSPKKNPTLWTIQWFELLTKIAHPTCRLATYSSTKAVWKAMMQAGWFVQDFPGFGKKRLSTLATLEGKTSSSVLAMLEKSPILALDDNA